MRPLVIKLAMADKKKVMDMEMAIIRMESDHYDDHDEWTPTTRWPLPRCATNWREFIYGKGRLLTPPANRRFT